MAKKKVKKSTPVEAIPTLQDLDKTISKAMKDLNGSIHINITAQVPVKQPEEKKKGAKKNGSKSPQKRKR